MRSLVEAFSSAAKLALEERGWKKRGGEVFTLDLGQGFHAWLGLNRATKYYPLEINPVVGVVYEPTRRLEQRLMGLAPSVTASLSEPLRYLADPSGAPLPFLRIADLADAARAAVELVRQVDAYGLPFAGSLATPGALVAALRDRKHLAFGEYALTRLPATLACLGREVEAREAMASGLRELGDRMDAAADHVRAFSEALLAYLDGEID